MSLPLSKLPPGVLNNRIREKIYEGVDLRSDNMMKVLRRVVAAQFGEHYTLVNREFTAICLYVLSDEEKQSLVTKGGFDKIANTSANNLQKKSACRVYIPEIHTDRALPDDIYNPSDKDKERMKTFFPVFVSETEDVASRPLRVGQLLQVKIKDNDGGGTFLYLLNDSNSRINIYNQNKPSNNAFKCSIFRFSRIVNAQGRSISLGKVITEEKTKTGNKLDEASLKQQYKKYLTEKEVYWYKKLKDYWKTAKFKGLIDNIAQLFDLGLSSKKLIWLLMQKFSAYSVTGVTNAGLTVLNVDSIDDSYGIFKHTKEQFDSFLLSYANKTLPLYETNNKYKSATDTFFSKENNFSHSDLIDPYASTYFFVLDFLNYLNAKGRTISSVATGLNLPKNQKIITQYFTDNDKRIGFIFSNDYENISDIYNSVTASPIAGRPNLNAATGNPPPFPNFEAWLTAAAGGAAVNIADFVKDDIKKPVNSQVLEAEKPKDTKDECHSNYPQRNSYLEHVDAQKALMRRYIESNISGEDLEFLSNMHEGSKTIIMSDSVYEAPFKIVRFDGNNGYSLDGTRWFNAKNNANLISNENYGNGYYRPRDLITKVTISTLNLKSETSKFYKNGLKLLFELNKPMPHFLITPEGQIIQLVDVAAAVKNGLSNQISSINIAFAEGIGTIENISGEKNTVLNNYILVSSDPTSNIYRPHKIGSKAALQAADKLIAFLSAKTNIKYNLAAQDFKLKPQDVNKSNIQAYGHYKGISGMNFVYYAWTYGLAYKNGGKNILSKQYGYN